jgi:elongation factor P
VPVPLQPGPDVLRAPRATHRAAHRAADKAGSERKGRPTTSGGRLTMISVTDLRNGTKVEMDGGLWECLGYQHQKIGRGGAKVVAKFRNLETLSIVERTFNSGEKLQDIFIDYRPMQYLYADGDTVTFMDLETFEQPTLDRGQIGDGVRFLKENVEVTVDYYQGRALKVTLPNVIELKIVETDPGVKGDTVSGGSKPAKLESGAMVQVPLFVSPGETVRVDTRSGEYLGRA